MMRKMNQEELNRWIGSQIYTERINRKMSQEALSEAVGISRNFLSMLENGNKAAKIDTYYRIACALDISLGSLFQGDKNNGVTEDILFLLSDCTPKESHALLEILRTAKTQLAVISIAKTASI